jgi:hypothetical protein
MCSDMFVTLSASHEMSTDVTREKQCRKIYIISDECVYNGNKILPILR